MPEITYNTDVEIDVDVDCANCSESLTATVRTWSNSTSLDVDPCPRCIAEAETIGAEGVDTADAYDEGHKDGLKEAYDSMGLSTGDN